MDIEELRKLSVTEICDYLVRNLTDYYADAWFSEDEDVKLDLDNWYQVTAMQVKTGAYESIEDIDGELFQHFCREMDYHTRAASKDDERKHLLRESNR